MRQSRLVLFLLLLVCAGAVVAWLIVQGPGQEAGSAAPISDLPANLDGAAPLSGEAGRKDKPATNREATPLEQPGDAKREPRPERPLKPDGTELGPEEWLVKGRVRFADGLPLDASLILQGEENGVAIYFRPDDAQAGHVWSFWPAMTGDCSFQEAYAVEDLPFPLRDGVVPPGRWQLTCPLEGNVRTMHDLGENLTIEQLPGLVTPTITGRVIDFGEVTLLHDILFGDQWLVTGRVVHSSGRAVANLGWLLLTVLDEDSMAAECYVATDAQGRFAGTFWNLAELAADPTAWNARLYPDENTYYQSEGSESRAARRIDVALPKPVVKGRVVDYGEIRVGGSLLEVEAVMEGLQPELLPDGRLRRSSWSEYPGRMGELYLGDGFNDMDVTIFPSPTKVTVWLPEGRYEYSGNLDGVGDYYPGVYGVVSVPDGQVVPLKLHFKRHRVIPLELQVPEGKQVSGATVRWEASNAEGEVVEQLTHMGSPLSAVPVFPGLTTRVRVESPGFAPVEGSVTDRDAKLVLKLEAVAAGVATLRIQVPELPEVIADRPEAFLSVVRLDNGGTVYGVNAGTGEHVVPVPAAGAYRVQLLGGGSWGYPGGVLSGPVEVTVKEGDDVPVTLPAIGPPPWPVQADGYVSNVRCAGRSISLETDVLIADGVKVGVSITTGQDFSITAPPLAIADGDASIPLDVPAPSRPDEKLTVSLDLEARIDVRVTRQGKPVASFQATATGAGGFSSSAGAVEGTALLWAPPGTATVTANVLGRGFSRGVEVKRSALARVDFELDAVRVEFDLGGDDERYAVDSSSEVPPPWRVYRLRDDSEEEIYDLWGDQVILMDPGRYRIVPGYGDPGLAQEIDISDGKDRVVNLPELPRMKLYSVRLKFDASALGDQWFNADISTCAVSRLARPDQYSWYNWVQTRALPDGIELLDVPADTELVVSGSIWLQRGDQEETWLLKPLRVKVSADGETINCTWVRGVPKGEEWWELQAFNVSLLPGLFLPLNEQDVLFPGRQELVFTGEDGKEAIREWVEVPAGTEEFNIPATLRAILEAKNLLAPREE
ncbi:MAG: hypothetical protein H6841_08790 [Planctomycetes bacterium]|nr:hypothetical protein [Planctomycetota bacterium]MCB9936149.1 hypothetical protein [Planctomycetota bacterium]